MAKKACIHHKDGDPTNNPPDGSNWEVLCWKCHRKIPTRRDKSGISITALFAPWKRAEIIRDRGYRCERCGADLVMQRTSNKPRPRCVTCGLIIDKKSDEIQWKNGKTMCLECFERNY